METSNKKRPEIKRDGRTSGKKKRSNGGVTTEDGELEEFLAILKRLQAGLKYYHQKKFTGDCVGNTVLPPPERDYGLVTPAFEVEDFVQFNDGRRKKVAGDLVRNDGVFGFDLNSDPGSGEKSD